MTPMAVTVTTVGPMPCRTLFPRLRTSRTVSGRRGIAQVCCRYGRPSGWAAATSVRSRGGAAAPGGCHLPRVSRAAQHQAANGEPSLGPASAEQGRVPARQPAHPRGEQPAHTRTRAVGSIRGQKPSWRLRPGAETLSMAMARSCLPARPLDVRAACACLVSGWASRSGSHRAGDGRGQQTGPEGPTASCRGGQTGHTHSRALCRDGLPTPSPWGKQATAPASVAASVTSLPDCVALRWRPQDPGHGETTLGKVAFEGGAWEEHWLRSQEGCCPLWDSVSLLSHENKIGPAAGVAGRAKWGHLAKQPNSDKTWPRLQKVLC